MPTTKTTQEAVKQITYLAAALKAPRITEAAARLAELARDAGWTHEDYLAAVLEREVSARNASGAQLRIRAAGFGARKTLEDFDWDAQPAIRQQVAALASGGFLTEARNLVLLGPPGTGKTHLATALGIVTARHGHRVLFATATDWVTRLTDAHRHGEIPAELAKLRRYGLIIVDEAGYLPFEQDAANRFFQLVSSRYEHASLILISNQPFSGWGGVFGDQAVATQLNPDVFKTRWLLIQRTPELFERQLIRMAAAEKQLVRIILRRFRAHGRDAEKNSDLKDEARMIIALGMGVMRFVMRKRVTDKFTGSSRELIDGPITLIKQITNNKITNNIQKAANA